MKQRHILVTLQINTVILSLIFITATSCTTVSGPSAGYSGLVQTEEAKFVQRMHTEKGWVQGGTGGAKHKSVESLFIDFVIPRTVDLHTARELVVETAIEYTNQINDNNELRPFLKNYSLSPKEIELALSFNTKECGDVGYVSLLAGTIRYHIQNSNDTESVIIESFQEAQQKLGLR